MFTLWQAICLPLVGVLVSWGWYQWKHRKALAFARKLPTVFPTLPLLGHLLYALPFLADLSDHTEQFQDIGEGPECDCLDFIIDGTSTLLAKKGVWRATRRSLDPVFHPKNVQLALREINKNSREFVKTLVRRKDGEYADILPKVQSATVFNLKEIALGNHVDIGPALADHIVEHVNMTFQLWGLRFIQYFMLCDMSKLFHKFNRKKIAKLQSDGVTITKPAMEVFNSRWFQRSNGDGCKITDTNSAVPLCLLDIYLSPPEKYKSTLTSISLYTNISTVVAAGLKTSSTAIATCLLMLAVHPEIQEKVFEEVVSVKEDLDSDVTPEDLQKMTFLDQVLKETTRLFPGIPIMSRNVTEDLKLSSSTAPKGVDLYIFIYGVHKHPHNYQNPDIFDPDRFSLKNTRSRHKYAYMTFGGGPRNCIGRDYAMVAIKTMVAHVVRRARLKTTVKMEDIRLGFSIEMFKKDGYPILVEKR